MDKQEAQRIHRELVAAITVVAEKNELEVRRILSKFGVDTFTMRAVLMETSEEAQRAGFELYCRKFSFEPTDFGKKIKVGGRIYKMVGFEPRRTKRPVVLIHIKSGKRFLMAPRGVMANWYH